MKKKNNLVKSTMIIMIVSLVSKAIGFLRDMLIANNFGAGMYTDAYNIAVTIPETIFTLIGLAISTAFLPMLSKILSDKGRKEMYDFANNVINILFMISIIFFIVSSIFSREIVSFLANGFSEEALNLAISLTRITLLNLLFLSVNACFTAMLQVNEDFVVPSILGLFFNLPMIIYLLFFKNYDIYGLTIANVIGNFLRVVVQVPPMMKHKYRYSLIVRLRDERLKQIIILIIPVIISAGANSLNMVVDKNIASSLEVGSISALDYGQKLITFINTIITTSVSSVAYPIMANMRNNGDDFGFMDILKKSIVYLAILLIPISIGTITLAQQIISVVYERGQFAQYAVYLTTLSLIGYGVGIFFTGMRDILNSTLFSMGKTTVTTINGVIGVVFNIILSIILSRYIGILGVSIASSIAMIITSILLFRSIKKIENSLEIKDMIKKIILLFICSIIMGSVIIALVFYLKYKLKPILILLVGTIIGIVVYFILCYIFKIKELMEIKDVFLAKIKK